MVYNDTQGNTGNVSASNKQHERLHDMINISVGSRQQYYKIKLSCSTLNGIKRMIQNYNKTKNDVKKS